jgi:hypothetical protein
MELMAPRGRLLVNETRPRFLIVSWYPHPGLPGGAAEWPGWTQDASMLTGFPAAQTLRGDRAAVLAWLDEQPWAHRAQAA